MEAVHTCTYVAIAIGAGVLLLLAWQPAVRSRRTVRSALLLYGICLLVPLLYRASLGLLMSIGSSFDQLRLAALVGLWGSLAACAAGFILFLWRLHSGGSGLQMAVVLLLPTFVLGAAVLLLLVGSYSI